MTTPKELQDKILATVKALEKDIEAFHKQPGHEDDSRVDILCDNLDDSLEYLSSNVSNDFLEYEESLKEGNI